MEVKRRPGVGVSAIVRKNNTYLLGKRLSVSHGAKTWEFPGGHLEFGETPEECAVRETLEETGVGIKPLKRVAFTNDRFEKESKHYITLFVLADWESGEPEDREPDKSGEWGWFAWDELPEPMFLPIKHLIESGYRPE